MDHELTTDTNFPKVNMFQFGVFLYFFKINMFQIHVLDIDQSVFQEGFSSGRAL